MDAIRTARIDVIEPDSGTNVTGSTTAGATTGERFAVVRLTIGTHHVDISYGRTAVEARINASITLQHHVMKLLIPPDNGESYRC